MKRWVISLVIIILIALAFFYFDPSQTEQEAQSSETWNKVFEKAFEPVNCPPARDLESLPEDYYKGPMIDTHIHMQSLPDGDPGMPLESYSGDNIGTKLSVDKWACMLQIEGTKSSFAFFPIWEPIISESIEFTKQVQERYPGKFIPFIMPPDDDGNSEGYPTVDAQTLQSMLEIEPDLFKGYGEIGLYARQDGAPALPPDSERLKEIYPIVREKNLIVYIHLGEGQKESLMRAAAENPDIKFIFHGDQLIDCAECDKTHKEVEEILESNPNVYYGVDELYGGAWLLKPGADKQEFIDHFKDYQPLLEADLAKFKDFIESHPDQVLWGTDRGVSASWDKDPDIAIILNDYARAFIGQLSPDVQDRLAYKNAEKLIEGR